MNKTFCGLSKLAFQNPKTWSQNGESRDVLATYKSKTDEKQLWNVRSFPDGTRNCYTLEPSGDKGTRYLIRARFMYGNYDSKDETTAFDLHIGVDFWARVDISSAEAIVTKEIMHVPPSKRVYVCLMNTGSGVPFISVLELRPMVESDVYQSPAGTALLLYGRYDFGLVTNQSYLRSAHQSLLQVDIVLNFISFPSFLRRKKTVNWLNL